MADGSMRLRLTDVVHVSDWDALSPAHKAQFEVCSAFYDDGAIPASERFTTEDWEVSFTDSVDRWALYEGDALRYELWLYRGDSGGLFAAGTDTLVGEVIQGHLHGTEDANLIAALADAIAARRSQPRPPQQTQALPVVRRR